MANTSYSTADDYMANGWYPGKKHGVGKRLLQGASMGIYNPDNRDESEYNKRILANKVQNAAARERAEDVMTITEKQRQLAMSNLERELTRMGIPPEQIQHISAASLGGGQDAMTQVAEGEAKETAARFKKARTTGALPRAGEAGAADIGEDIATSVANAELADETVEEADARRREGIPDRKAKSSAAKLDYNRNLDEFNTEKTSFDWDSFNTTADREMQTRVKQADNKFAEANIAGAEAKAGQRMADAMVDEITSPGMADVYTKANLNKAGAQNIGVGVRSYQPGGDVLEGTMMDYAVVPTGPDSSTTVRKMRPPGMSTAEPAPAPAGVTGSLGTLVIDPKTGRFTPKAKN